MKNILCSLVALVCVAGVAKADDSILGTTATVKMEKSASAWFNNGYYGAVRDTKTNEDSPVALWDVPQVKARLLSVKVNPVVGVQFGNTARKSAVVAGLVVPVATVKGTQVSFVGTVGVGENWTKRPNGSLGLVVRR